MQSNPILDLNALNDIENKIRNNSESIDDLQKLNFFMSNYDSEYLNSKIKEFNLYSFEGYLEERKKPFDKQNPNLSFMVGNFLGAISYLKKSIL